MGNFPTSIISTTDPSTGNFLNSPSHSSQHATINDEVVALETKVGINGSADPNSLDYKINHLQVGIYAKVRKNTNQTMTGGLQTIVWDVPELDSNSQVDLANHNDRITIKTAGVYLVGAIVSFNNTTSNAIIRLIILQNGSNIIGDISANSNQSLTIQPGSTISTILNFAQNDYITVQATHSLNADIIGDDPGKTELFITKQG